MVFETLNKILVLMEVQSNFWSGILRFYDSRLVLVYTSKFTAAGQSDRVGPGSASSLGLGAVLQHLCKNMPNFQYNHQGFITLPKEISFQYFTLCV